MRKELYNALCKALKEVDGGVIKHVDLWNHNVEYIEQEENWARPAVFVEFCPVKWETTVHGVRYVSEPLIRLHIVTDWAGSAADGSEFKEQALELFDLTERIQERLVGLEGETFRELDLVSSETNHNHEDIVETIETYQCVGYRILPQ